MTRRERLEQFGELGERWAAGELRRRGFNVVWIGGNTDYDLLLEGVARVEVKSALLSGRHGRGTCSWQFSLRRHGRLVDEELLLLLCFDDLDAGPLAAFVIPGAAVPADLTKIHISSRDPRAYAGKWAAYRDAWHLVRPLVLCLYEKGRRQLAMLREVEIEEPIVF